MKKRYIAAVLMAALALSLGAAALADEPTPARLDYFVCGAPALVATAFHACEALGVPADQVRTEQFDMA